MSAIWGIQMRAAPDPDNECTWSASTGLPSFSTRFEPSNLATARSLLANDADIEVSGNAGVIGNLFGLAVYVQHGPFDFVVQTVELADTPDNRAKVIATAEKALSRVP